MVVMVLVSPHALVTPAYTHHLGRLVCQLHSPATTETVKINSNSNWAQFSHIDLPPPSPWSLNRSNCNYVEKCPLFIISFLPWWKLQSLELLTLFRAYRLYLLFLLLCFLLSLFICSSSSSVTTTRHITSSTLHSSHQLCSQLFCKLQAVTDPALCPRWSVVFRKQMLLLVWY